MGYRIKTSDVDVDLLGDLDRANDPRPRLFADRFPNAAHLVTVSTDPPPIWNAFARLLHGDLDSPGVDILGRAGPFELAADAPVFEELAREECREIPDRVREDLRPIRLPLKHSQHSEQLAGSSNIV